MFIGRQEELETLKEFGDNKECSLLCLTGRRGMGKSALLKEFLKDKPHIYFNAYPTTDTQALGILYRQMMRDGAGQSGIGAGAVGSGEGAARQEAPITLEEFLFAIEEKAKENKKGGVFYVAFDGYPNFAKASDGYAEALVNKMTESWRDMGIKLILCGDSFLQMEKLACGKKSAWKRVKKITMTLKELSYYEARELFPAEREGEDAFYYGISGGIPAQILRLKKTYKDSILSLFFSGDTGLLPEETLSHELRELSYYNRMLCTLASGKNRVNQMSEAVGKPKDVVVPYMNTLMSLDVVTKETPVTEKTNRKKTRYSIVNFYDVFWYQLIVPNMDLVYEGAIDELIDQRILPELEKFLRPVFIRMCREYLLGQSKEGKLPLTISEIGNWWENDEEKKTSQGFDLVALGKSEEGDSTMFARCFDQKEPVNMAELKGLIDMTKKLNGRGEVFYVAFSVGGFDELAQTAAEAIRNIMLVSLSDVHEFRKN